MIFSDDSRMSIFSLDGRAKYWIHDPKGCSEHTIIQIVKYGGSGSDDMGMFVYTKLRYVSINMDINKFWKNTLMVQFVSFS